MPTQHKDQRTAGGSSPARSLGLYIQSLRTARGEDGAEVAERSGISRSYLSKIERGNVGRPDVSVIDRLARALAVPPTELRAIGGYEETEEAPHILAAIQATQAQLTELRRSLDLQLQRVREKVLHVDLPIESALLEAGKALALEKTDLAQGLLESVEDFLSEAVTETTIQVQMGLSDVARLRGDLMKALRKAQLGYALLTSMPSYGLIHTKLCVALLYRLAELQTILRDFGPLHRPLRYIERAIDLRQAISASDLGHPRSMPPLAELYRVKATILTAAGRWEEARQAYETALELVRRNEADADEPTRKTVEATILQNMCWYYLRRRLSDDDYRAALEYCLEGLQLTSQLGDPDRPRAYYLGYLSTITFDRYLRASQLIADRDVVRPGLAENADIVDLLEKIDDVLNTAPPRQEFAGVQLIRTLFKEPRGDHKTAEWRMLQALHLFERIGDDENRAETLLALAGIYQEDRKLARAAVTAQQSLVIGSALELELLQARAYRRLGMIFSAANDHRAGRKCLDASLKILEGSAAVDDQNEMARTLRELGKALAKLTKDKDTAAYRGLQRVAIRHLQEAEETFAQLGYIRDLQKTHEAIWEAAQVMKIPNFARHQLPTPTNNRPRHAA